MSGRSRMCDLWFSQTLLHKNYLCIHMYMMHMSEGLGWELFKSRIFWVAHGRWYSGADTYAAGTSITFPHCGQEVLVQI